VLSNMSAMRSDMVMPLRDESYILYVDHATSSVNAVSGRVTCSHLSKASEENDTSLSLRPNSSWS
jgi:hypothetical protein